MLPEGVPLGKMEVALKSLIALSPTFTGVITITEQSGDGLLLAGDGKILAARFVGKKDENHLSAAAALEYLLKQPRLNCALRKHALQDLHIARLTFRDWGCLISGAVKAGASKGGGQLSKERLEQIGRQPGVIAVSVFHEGFALQSTGDADFERVAAIAEDLLRAGVEITEDMEMGSLSQMILETPVGKLIIAPYGELYLCVLTRSDAHLGLIRLVLSGIQNEVQER